MKNKKTHLFASVDIVDADAYELQHPTQHTGDDEGGNVHHQPVLERNTRTLKRVRK